MDTVISLLVFSCLTKLVVPQAPPLTSFRAVVELASESRIFSGESLRLKCSIPDNHRSTWRYLWFKGSEQLPQTEDNLFLWKARVKESGKYYCQGWRDTAIGSIHTLQSLPVEIDVDGGWAILQVPPHPSLVGDTLKITCRVRANPQFKEVFLYKDGVEVMRIKSPDRHFTLTNVTLADQGIYSCRASWDIDRKTRSVISSEVLVQVLEVLTQPILDIVTNLSSGGEMKLICHVQYNAPAPAPPINYYFYKNGNQLGVATSKNQNLFRRTPGTYSCRVKVPQLGIFRWSKPKVFGQVTGQMMKPQAHSSRDPQHLAPTISSPVLSLPAAAQSTAPSFIQPAELTSQRPGRFLKPSPPAPSTPPATVRVLNQTAAESAVLSGGAGEVSGNRANDAVDMSGNPAATVLP